MWQAPIYRLRAHLRAKEVQRKRDNERELRRSVHSKRVRAELRLLPDGNLGETPVFQGRLILNDLTSSGARIFSPQPIRLGQEMALTLDEPRRFYVRARVVWCQSVPLSNRVLTQTPLLYRLGLQFVFRSPAERVAVERFCERIYSEHLYHGPGKPVVGES